MICLVDHHNLEALLRAQVNLLCLGNFLEQILYDHSVIVSDI